MVVRLDNGVMLDFKILMSTWTMCPRRPVLPEELEAYVQKEIKSTLQLLFIVSVISKTWPNSYVRFCETPCILIIIAF